ncbi:MAG: DUF952 domain-containing protein [Pyrinomonadaceae bacterium]
MRIYHIVLPDVWTAFDTDLYEHPSLTAEGFIHCSFTDQLDGVIGRYYSGEERVVVLEIESSKLMSRLIKEPSTNSEIYPHIYGPINRDAIISAKIKELPLDPRN